MRHHPSMHEATRDHSRSRRRRARSRPRAERAGPGGRRRRARLAGRGVRVPAAGGGRALPARRSSALPSLTSGRRDGSRPDAGGRDRGRHGSEDRRDVDRGAAVRPAAGHPRREAGRGGPGRPYVPRPAGRGCVRRGPPRRPRRARPAHRLHDAGRNLVAAAALRARAPDGSAPRRLRCRRRGDRARDAGARAAPALRKRLRARRSSSCSTSTGCGLVTDAVPVEAAGRRPPPRPR